MRRADFRALGLHLQVGLGRDSSHARQDAQYRAANNHFEGDYANWADALAHAGGYAQDSILQKSIAAARKVQLGEAAYERDTVTFAQREYSYPQLAWMLFAAARSGGRLQVLDFGGALGSTFRQYQPALSQLPHVQWGVVEQTHYVQAGTAQFADAHLSFHDSTEDCLAAVSPNLGLMSATLQYLDDPHAHLERLLSLGLPHLLIDKTLAHPLGRDRLVIQHVPAHIYAASYPVWLLDAEKLERAFARHGYCIVDKFDPYPGSVACVDDFSAGYTSWFLQHQHQQP